MKKSIEIGDTIFIAYGSIGLRKADIIKIVRPIYENSDENKTKPIIRFKIRFSSGSENGVYRDERDIVYNFGSNPNDSDIKYFKKQYHKSKKETRDPYLEKDMKNKMSILSNMVSQIK
jgi:hypothetical protein|tara:strand:+ start:99 stop:452 length:354 start_codon:yes stop_codon:yes gene_type:complete